MDPFAVAVKRAIKTRVKKKKNSARRTGKKIINIKYINHLKFTAA